MNIFKGIVQWFSLRQRPAVSDETLAKTYARIRDEYPELTQDYVSSFLLTEAKELVSDQYDGIKNLESKAATQLTAAIGALGLLSILGSSVAEHLAPSPWLFGGVGCIVLALVGNAICLWPTAYKPPARETYADTLTLSRPEYKARIQAELLQGFFADYRRLEIPVLRKSRAFGAASSLFVLGVVCLFANYIVTLERSRPRQVVRCNSAGTRIVCRVEEK